MIRLIAFAGFAMAAATSVQAMTPAPMAQPSGVIVQVREGCGPGMIWMNGGCVARSTIRQDRREGVAPGYRGYGAYQGDYQGNRGYYSPGTVGLGLATGCSQTRTASGRIITTCQ
jgi:hypothetical protein